MWPWEHLAVGYLVYSGYLRVRRRELPSGWETVTLALATQLPDLVDKPLAWSLGILPHGMSLAHSLLTAVPVSLTIIALTRIRQTPSIGTAFVVGYLAHLLGDMTYSLLISGSLSYQFLFWPLIERPQGDETAFLTKFWALAGRFWQFLGTPRGRLYLLFEVVLVGAALMLWVRHGQPGLRRSSYR